MRELERDSSSNLPGRARLAVIGAGRLGWAISIALRAAGREVDGPLGRGADGGGADLVLLSVPDAEIASAAGHLSGDPLVGHCSGATTLDVLAPYEAFSIHPLMTVSRAGANFRGAGAAVAGTTHRARACAAELAVALGMHPIEVAEEDRIAYHAAASMASNFLITLEAAAEELAGTAGLERELLVPLVRATVENWSTLGPRGALTGPVARGDGQTVQAQRAVVAERTPELLTMFDALVDGTRRLAESREPHPV